MRLLFKMAWRNIWRNKRRSILTLLAVGFATLASIAMRGVQLGTYEINIVNAVEMLTGYIQIQRPDYKEDRSVNQAFYPDENLITRLSEIPHIVSFSRRIYADGLISKGDNSLGAAIIGVDKNEEQKVSRILTRVTAGKVFDNPYEIVIGYKLLDNLKSKIGDEVVVLAQGADGSMGNLKFKVVGALRTGSPQIDEMGVMMNLETADELLAMYGRIHAIAIKVDELTNIQEVKENILPLLNRKLGVYDWGELMPDFKETIEFDNISGIFYLLILISIVAFGILNTVLMSVTERFNEFGVTLAIGMPQLKLVLLVLIETMMLALTGILIGNLLGWGVNYYLFVNPVEFGGEIKDLYELYGFMPVIKSSLEFSIFLNTTLTVMIISAIAVIYPLYKVYNLEPLKGIRYT
ncbi:MAG: ABC transporter permease [Melioribacter sp.]|uniref:ABC transporter permease n=1 Tax=Melioribacter sp. TaxID=2052167 RepID=UPI003BE8008D